jgi:hypothetical protein
MSTFSDAGLRLKADFIGGKGWVIPFQLAPGNVRDLLEDIQLDQPQDIDNMFVAFYEDWVLLPRVFNSLKSDAHFAKYNTLMSQVAACYDLGHYAIVVAGAVSVIEGLLVDLTNDKSQSMGGKLKAIETAANTDFDILTAPVLISLNAFLKPLYAHKSFQSVQPVDLNRHWINHGRAELKDSRTDALKVINAVNSLGYAVKFLVP